MERVFCKNCGNKTLRKVAVSVNVDGSLTYHLPRRKRPVNLRGTKVSSRILLNLLIYSLCLC